MVEVGLARDRDQRAVLAVAALDPRLLADAGAPFVRARWRVARLAGLALPADRVHVFAAAKQAAAERNLTNATFVEDDITSFTGFDGRFDTILDSTLFHSIPVEARDGYQQAVFRAAAPGAKYFILVFAKGAFPAELETKPNEVDEDELRSAVSKYFAIDEIRPATIHSHRPEFPDVPAGVTMPIDLDEKGRLRMPAYLLSAHKAD